MKSLSKYFFLGILIFMMLNCGSKNDSNSNPGNNNPQPNDEIDELESYPIAKKTKC